ncbi:nudix domain-containing protein [Ceratocystis lukuohia]|uniref:Nudix domain-containing protein n=1 Tax=Ceratocystis lukuohia TaxID=2019550 RepID=A0ABR4MIE1_9PEZI
MKFSIFQLLSITLLGSFGPTAVHADSGLLENDWGSLEYYSDVGINAWKLPGGVTYIEDDEDDKKEGSVYLGEVRIRCGVVPYDEDGDVWMIASRGDFKNVGYIFPRGGYDYRYDTDMEDCVIREAKEESGFDINKDSISSLGISADRGTYWFKAKIDSFGVATDPEPRPAEPKWFHKQDARDEMQRPYDRPGKKREMRVALYFAE